MSFHQTHCLFHWNCLLWDAPIKLLVCLLKNVNSLKLFTHMWENLKFKKELTKSVNYLINVLTSSLSDNIALGEVILREVIFSSAFCNKNCKLDRKSKLWNLNSPKIFHKIIVFFIRYCICIEIAYYGTLIKLLVCLFGNFNLLLCFPGSWGMLWETSLHQSSAIKKNITIAS